MLDTYPSNPSNSAPLARVAQSVEQGIENPRVGGSIPSPGTTNIEKPQAKMIPWGFLLPAIPWPPKHFRPPWIVAPHKLMLEEQPSTQQKMSDGQYAPRAILRSRDSQL
jgi:hypothetical protein